ncbi:helix-turn-helix transcriptional regulator [Ferrovibrio sp.]|uniref:helix-turn-helix domain-containing protein n=1 Tax=Ferrovibrio sp. TaxID=1917215 RepID=UPI0031201ED2
MDMRKLVGRNVRRVRQDKGYTQEEFAEKSGFSQQYISDLERGRRNPTVVTLYELATALGVSHLDLVTPEVRPTDEKVARSVHISNKKAKSDNER